jgi:Type IV secretion system pilin
VPTPHPPALPGRLQDSSKSEQTRSDQSVSHQSKEAATSRLSPISRWVLRRLPIVALAVVVFALVFSQPAMAATSAPTLTSVIDNLRNWLVGVLAAVATLFLTIGGLRYLTAGGDPVQVEKAKTALKSAAIGYALAILAPLIVSIVGSVVGG